MRFSRLRSTRRLLSAAAGHWVAAGRARPVLPYKVNLHLTYECNTRCVNCRIWDVYNKDPALKAQELPTERWLEIVDGIAPHAVWLSFSGGEPTRRDDLATIVCRALDTCSRLALVNIAVNGIDPDRTFRQIEPIARRTRDVPVYVAVGLDALGEAQDGIRGVPGAYAAARDTFTRLKHLEPGRPGFHVLFHMTLGTRNYGQAADVFEFVRRRGVGAVTLAQESSYYRNEGTGVDLRGSLAGQGDGVAARLWRESGWWPPEAWPPRFYLGLASYFLREGRSPIPCAAGLATVTVDPFGRALPCPYRDVPMGRLADHHYRIAELIESQEAREALERVKGCRRCWHNCEALPSMLQHPLATLAAAAREARLGARRASR